MAPSMKRGLAERSEVWGSFSPRLAEPASHLFSPSQPSADSHLFSPSQPSADSPLLVEGAFTGGIVGLKTRLGREPQPGEMVWTGRAANRPHRSYFILGDN